MNNNFSTIAQPKAKQIDQNDQKLSIKNVMTKTSEQSQSKSKTLMQQQDNKQEQHIKKQTQDFIASLDDLKKAAEIITQSQQGPQCLLNVLQQENQFLMDLFPDCKEFQVEGIYMLDLGLNVDSDTLKQVQSKGDNSEQLRRQILDKTSILTSTMEVLRILLKNEQFKKQVVIQLILKEILGFSRLFCRDQQQCVLALRILNEIVVEPQFQTILQENRFVESIFFVLNNHPIDKDIQELSGNVLKNLGAEKSLKSVKEQFECLPKQFDSINQKSMSIAQNKVNINLANLMTIAPQEETTQIINENKSLIKCLQAFLTNQLPREVLGSVLLLIARMSYQGDETKKLLRFSSLPQQIASTVFIDKIALDRIPSLAIEAISNMIGGGQETLNSLDQNGEEYEQETDQILLGYLDPIQNLLLKSNNQHLSYILSMLKTEMIGNQNMVKLKATAALGSRNYDTETLHDNSYQRYLIALQQIEKSSQLITKFLRYDKNSFPLIFQLNAHEICLQIFRKMCESQSSISIKAQVFQLCGGLLAELSHLHPDIFIKVCQEDSIMNTLIKVIHETKVNDSFVNNLSQMEQIHGLIKFLIVLLDKNKFDKTLIMKRQLGQELSELLKKFLDYFSVNILVAQEQVFFGVVLKDILQTQYLILLDPIMGNDILPETYIISIQRFLESSLKLTSQKEDTDDSEEIFGSSDPFVRIIEVCFKVLDQSLKKANVCHYYSSQFRNDQTVIRVAFYHYNNPFLVCKAYSIIIKLLQNIDDKNTVVEWNLRLMYLRKNIKEYQKVNVQSHPKIAIISRQYDEIIKILAKSDIQQYEQVKKEAPNKMICVEKVDLSKEEVTVKAELKLSTKWEQFSMKNDNDSPTKIIGRAIKLDNQMMGSDHLDNVIKSLELIANTLDIILSKALNYSEMSPVQKKNQEVDWIPILLKLIQAVREYVQDDQTASKVHQIQVTNTLLSFLIMDDLLGNDINYAVIECLAYISQYKEALLRNEDMINIYDTYKSYGQYLFSVKDPKKNKCISPFFKFMKNVEMLDEIQQKIIKQNQVQLLVQIMVNSIGNQQAILDGAQCLDRYGSSSKIAQIYFEEGVIKIIVDQFPKYYTDPVFANSFCLLIGTVCRYQPSQALLTKNLIHKIIIESMSGHLDDIKQLSNNFYAISGLCYNNKSLANEIISSPLLNYIKESLTKYYTHPVLVETICSVISNLVFQNDQNKLIIGNSKIIEQLHGIFSYYCFKHPQFRPETLNQILRALGNICFILPNSTKLVQSGFLDQSIKLLNQKLQFKEQGEIIKCILDVYANLCSHPEEQNRSNIEVLLKEGILDTILSSLKNNVLQGDVAFSGMDAIDGFIQNKMISLLVTEKGGIDTVLDICRSQQSNGVVVTRCYRLLANLSIQRPNIDYFLEAQVPLFIAETIRDVQITNPKLLTYAYKILNRIANAQKVIQDLPFQYPGFFEAINEILQKRGIYDNHLELVQLMNKLSQRYEALEVVATTASDNLLYMILNEPKELPNTDQFIRECLNILLRICQEAQLCQYVDIDSVIQVLQTSMNSSLSGVDDKIEIMKQTQAMCASNEQCRMLCIKHGLDKDIQALSKSEQSQKVKQVIYLDQKKVLDATLRSIQVNKRP